VRVEVRVGVGVSVDVAVRVGVWVGVKVGVGGGTVGVNSGVPPDRRLTIKPIGGSEIGRCLPKRGGVGVGGAWLGPTCTDRTGCISMPFGATPVCP
jgi:hypothetical protein